MSLDWDAKKCDPEVLTESEFPVTEALIFASMSIGMRGIPDEAAADKFAARLYAWQRVYGPAMTTVKASGLEGLELTLADVKKRIGLMTNASPATDASFRAQLARRLMTDAEDRVRRESTQ
jgi:hypothetical protein